MNAISSRRRHSALPAVVSALTAILCFGAIGNAQEQSGSAPVTAQATTSAAPASATPNPDPAWHTAATLYLWFPGVHGTMGAGGHNVDFRASPGDLLSNFRFGLMGIVQAQRDRFVLLGDLMWVRLRADRQRSLPFPGLPQITAQVKTDQFIVNPEIGYRFLDGERIKMDALWGMRYWHLGSSLQFTPSLTGFNFSGSRNWADVLMGARIQVPLSTKVVATIWGDEGGLGLASQLDYQILGALGFNVSPKLTLRVGYRYLYVNYRSGSFVYDTAMSGTIIGLTYNFK